MCATHVDDHPCRLGGVSETIRPSYTAFEGFHDFTIQN
jgi:hypothetical protein